MSLNDVLLNALQILEDSVPGVEIGTRDEQVITAHQPPKDLFQEYDDIVHELATRSVAKPLVSSEEHHISMEMDFVESSALNAQAMVSLDYFNERFNSEKCVKELLDVSMWIDETARNHSNFLFQIESKRRADFDRNAIDEDDTENGHLHNVEASSIPQFSELREEYLDHNSRIFRGMSFVVAILFLSQYDDLLYKLCRFNGAMQIIT